jgi:hypothetical protein
MAALIAPSLRGVANEVIYPESDGKTDGGQHDSGAVDDADIGEPRGLV